MSKISGLNEENGTINCNSFTFSKYSYFFVYSLSRELKLTIFKTKRKCFQNDGISLKL